MADEEGDGHPEEHGDDLALPLVATVCGLHGPVDGQVGPHHDRQGEQDPDHNVGQESVDPGVDRVLPQLAPAEIDLLGDWVVARLAWWSVWVAFELGAIP